LFSHINSLADLFFPFIGLHRTGGDSTYRKRAWLSTNEDKLMSTKITQISRRIRTSAPTDSTNMISNACAAGASFVRRFRSVSAAVSASMLLVLISTDAVAADWYVRSGTGGNGTSWSSAWSDVTSIGWSSVQPGDTIWVSGGRYGSLNVGKSGNADTAAGRISVKRATAVAHGSDSGWSANYDGQVVLSGIVWSSQNVGSYVTIDGQVDSGIAINHGDGDGATSVTFDRGASYVTLRYLDIGGPGDANGFHHAGDDRGIDITAWNGSTYDAVDYLKVQYSKIHGACTQIWNMNASHGIWEHNRIYNSTDSNGNPCHPNIFVTASSSDVTFRYNEIYNYDAEGIMIINGGHGSLYVYGNVWHDGKTYARVIEVQNGVNGPVYFYNNVVDGLWAGFNTANAGQWAQGSQGRNNIWWNMDGSGLPDEDYDFCSGSCSGSNSISGGSNPFVDLSAKNYRIASTIGTKYPRDRGVNLGTTFGLNIDFDGGIRGADGIWDIGAFEFNAGTSLPPPTGLSVK
jgi:hypothetical protein